MIKWKQIDFIFLKINDPVISKTVFGNIAFGDYEIDENKILKETLTKDDIVLELGTGIGYNSITAAKITRNKVVTFEGNPKLIPVIRQNLKKNNVQIELHNKVLVAKSLEPATYSFNVGNDFWKSSLKGNIDTPIVERVTVPTHSVHEVLDRVHPTYLIVDIEGGEEEFFADCEFLEQSSINNILIELHVDVIGQRGCFEVVSNIIKSGFSLRIDDAPKNVMYFYR